MKKPKSFNVFGQEIKVRYVKNLIEDDEINGDYCQREKSIRIDSSLIGQALLSTMIHETIHAIFDRIGINQGVDSGVEEIIADSVAICLIENYHIEPF